MKILFLHGYGTSGEIFEQQLSSILAMLGAHHTYVFLDGEVPVTRTELAGFIPGKNLAYYDGYEAAHVASAHELLHATIEAEEVPFDGVVGYSQGGSFVISYMIQQQIEHPEKPPPFRWALFFSPGFVLSPDPDYNEKDIMYFVKDLEQEDRDAIHTMLIERKPVKPVEEFVSIPKLNERQKDLCIALVGTAATMLATREVFHIEESNSFSMDGRPQDSYGPRDFPRFFHPVYTEQRLPIATVFVHGSEDDEAPRRLARIAQGLCAPDKMIIVENPGVHEIPNKAESVGNVVRAIEKAHYMGQRLVFDI